MKNVYIVPHVHWDREWYFSAEESKILLVNDLKEVLDFLEANPEYPSYILDGQTSIIKDFSTLCPEEMPRFKKLVEDGRLIIGPWYTQTDEMVVGGESIVRNLLYGIKDSQEFGEPMKIGYLPDSFGQSAQIPQILNGFEITRSVFWRGISERYGTDKTEFNWLGPSGSKVTTQLLPLGYAIGKYLPMEEEPLKKRMDKYFKVLDKGATTDNILVPNGHDQMPIQKNISEVIAVLKKLYTDRNFMLGRFEVIFKEIEKIDLPDVQGEFIDGKYSRVHRSIYSTRMDLKASNVRIENKITNILEPLMSVAYALGFDYQEGTVEAIWKDLMVNHAHDSMAACCSDKVHAEILARYNSVEERTDRLIDFYMRKVSEATTDYEETEKLVVYNLFQNARKKTVRCEVISKKSDFIILDQYNNEIPYQVLSKEVIDPGLIDRQIVHYGDYEPFIQYEVEFTVSIGSVGYKTLYIAQGKHYQTTVETQGNVIENVNYKIEAQMNGTINVYDKRSGKHYKEILGLENVADDGDEYDFSPLTNDQPLYSADSVTASINVNHYKESQELNIYYQWSVPNDIEERKHKFTNGRIGVEIAIQLTQNDYYIPFEITLDNDSKDQRTRLLVPTQIASKLSTADNQFGLVQRPVVDDAINVWEKEDWDERPDAIYPFLSAVALSEAGHTAAVFTNSTREYEIVGKTFETIAITLFRSVGTLGKENLLRRPGRPSGIKMATPHSQMLGRLKLSLALFFSNEEFDDANVLYYAKEFLTPIYTYNQIPYNAMKLNKENIQIENEYSLFDLEETNLIMSTIKKAEGSNMVLARLFNGSKKTEMLPGKAERYRLNETLYGLCINESLEPNEVGTFRIK